jgi:hypothetical protein
METVYLILNVTAGGNVWVLGFVHGESNAREIVAKLDDARHEMDDSKHTIKEVPAYDSNAATPWSQPHRYPDF